MVFRVPNPEMAQKPKYSRKPMSTLDDKKSYMARLVLMRQVSPCLTRSNLVNLADCYSQIRKFDCVGCPIAWFNQVTDQFWIQICLCKTSQNPKPVRHPIKSRNRAPETVKFPNLAVANSQIDQIWPCKAWLDLPHQDKSSHVGLFVVRCQHWFSWVFRFSRHFGVRNPKNHVKPLF